MPLRQGHMTSGVFSKMLHSILSRPVSQLCLLGPPQKTNTTNVLTTHEKWEFTGW
jgi:hypothetical protein